MAENNNDVFGIDHRIGDAWSLDGAVIKIEGGDEIIVNSVDITYRRQSQKFSPLNQNKKFIAIGEADGTVALGLIIGPSAAIKNFLARYSSVCTLKKNTLQISPAGFRFSKGNSKEDCNQSFQAVTFTCTGCIINSLRISVRQTGGALTVVNAGIDMQFIALKVGPNEGTGAAAA
jgi:hypothetical protein